MVGPAPLPTDIENGDNGHAGFHNATNERVNAHQATLEALPATYVTADTSMMYGSLLAHRATFTGSGKIENTIAAATSLPGWAVPEIDVRRSSDGVWFCNHDATLQRLWNTAGNLSAQTAATLDALGLSRFTEMLTAMATQAFPEIYVDIPSDIAGDVTNGSAWIAEVVAIVKASVLSEKCIVMVRSSTQMTAVRAADSTVRVGCFDIREDTAAARIATALTVGAEVLFTAVTEGGYVDHRGVVPLVQAAGLRAGASTVSDFHTLAIARIDGIDAVLTDLADQLAWYAGGSRHVPGLYAPAINPNTLTRAFHFDASAITGLADGDPVTTWADISGNARDATEATNKPAYKTNARAGKAAVRFDGVNDRMRTAALGAPIAQPVTFFVAARILSETLNDLPIIDSRASTGATRLAFGLSLVAGGDDPWYMNAGGTVQKTSTDADSLSPHVFAAQFAGATSALWVDNVHLLYGVNPGSNTLDSVSIANRGSDGLRSLNADIYEVVVITGALTDLQIAGVSTFLRLKWSI